MNPLMNAMKNAGNVNQIFQMLKTGNPEIIAQNMMQSNPSFKRFIESNKGKTPQQVAQENGIDLNQIIGMIK